MMNDDVWDTIELTPAIKEKLDALIRDPNLMIERRGDTTYYPGRLFMQEEDAQVTERRVIVGDKGATDLAIISTVFIHRHDNAVLVLRLKDSSLRELKGKIFSSRPGKRPEDRDDGKLNRFIAGFRPAPKENFQETPSKRQ